MAKPIPAYVDALAAVLSGSLTGTAAAAKFGVSYPGLMKKVAAAKTPTTSAALPPHLSQDLAKAHAKIKDLQEVNDDLNLDLKRIRASDAAQQQTRADKLAEDLQNERDENKALSAQVEQLESDLAAALIKLKEATKKPKGPTLEELSALMAKEDDAYKVREAARDAMDRNEEQAKHPALEQAYTEAHKAWTKCKENLDDAKALDKLARK